MKLILADSNEIIRIGLRTLLSTERNIQIVGEARNNEELIALNKAFDANIILVDYTSKGFSIDVIPQILQKKPDLSVVAITPEQSAQTLVNALRSGVKSYIKKDCDSSEIIDSIRETWRGNKFFCGQILETIRDASIDVNDIDFESFSCEPITLSERETEIITMISEGLTNIMIADSLCLSNHTINTHRKNIMAKLGVKNTAGIVIYAVKTNLVSPNKFLFAADSNS
ncbi:LuxR C-terminal-related transcriptional regulator [Fluviicola taffensis]|uniref:Two component transcriptional regulator, LuxR family n=1 Tax=Fluviicola taffensis (strain DSM 16823 / NCIMB 13979 / RW262) TaxID=755732 RepID=F2IHU7_FLUTR|nr:response regulator transcription factor [Fluviicola taffensis]AEA45906.1 two component transcriptional regulator, LuxR family [Fluviicola taffensis DSM 16823]